MSGPVTFVFADPARRTWLALNSKGDGYHVVSPTPDDAQLIVDGLRHVGQLSCSCAGGRYRGTCYVTKEAEAIEAGLADGLCRCEASTARDGHIHEADGSVLCLHHEGEDGSDCPQTQATSGKTEPTWFDAPAEAVEA